MMKEIRYFKLLLVFIGLMVLPSAMSTAHAGIDISTIKYYQEVDGIWYLVDPKTQTAAVGTITGNYTSLTIPSYVTVNDKTALPLIRTMKCEVTGMMADFINTGTLQVDTLIIPESVVTIQDGAFHSITTPTTLKFLGSSNDAPIEIGCASLSDGTALCSPMSNLTSVILDRNLSYTAPSAKKPFEGLSKLTTVEIGADVDSISTNCFRNTSIMSVTLSSQGRLSAIYSGAFSNCSQLKSVTLPKCASGPLNIMSGAFTSSGLYNIITLGYTNIQSKAFESCKSMKAVAFGGRTNVASEAFASCSAIEEVHFEGDSVIFLADKSFSNCTSIKLVTIDHRQTPDDSEGVSTAFAQTTYNNATFVNYGDDAFNKVDLSQTEPWLNFKNVKQATSATLDIYNPESMLGTEFSNIKMPYTIKKGQCELFCLPFDIDSYYFGSDATIYTMSQDSINHVTVYPNQYLTTDVNVYYNKLDIDKTETIPACTPFLVIPQRNDSIIQATINLFKTSMVKFTSRDSVYTWYGDYDLEEWNSTYNVASASQQRFIVVDGCLKRVNSTNHVIPAYTPTLYTSESIYFSPHYMDGNAADSVTCILRDSIMITPHQLLEGYITFYSNESNFEIPSEDYKGQEVPEIYTVTGIEDGQLVLHNVYTDYVINKGEAVLIKRKWKDAGKPFRLRMVTDKSSDTEAYEHNILKGVDVDTPVSELCSAGNSGVYVLSRGEDSGVGFYHLGTGRTMPAHKAYIETLEAGSKSNPDCFLIGGETSGIKSVTSGNNSDGATYDLSGRKVSGKLKNGIYIKNNRKEIVR